MAHRIKFRGRCAGVWRKGDYLTHANGDVIKQWSGSISPEYDVEPDTVGQFTGFYDSDGTEIYEDDYVNFVDYGYTLLVARDTVDYELTFFDTKGRLSEYRLSDIRNAKTVVIGNLHDNPELWGS